MVPEYLGIADIGISYIPINEFFDRQPALKTLEYLAGGLPVIATNTAGNRLFIKHGYNGLLTGDDEDGLAQAIESLAADRKLREELACNSRGSVKDFDWTQIVKGQLLPVYETVLARLE